MHELVLTTVHIFGVLAKEGGAHYEGGCFVFDERGVLDPTLKEAKPPEFKLIDR